MVILLTGFEPFGGSDKNPSQELVELFQGTAVEGQEIYGAIIKLDYSTIHAQFQEVYKKASEKGELSLTLLLGQYNKADISLERIAINLAHTGGTPYNCGTIPKNEKLDKDSPAAYFTNADIQGIYQQLKKKGIPSHLSLSAGSFGCNQLYYYALNNMLRLKEMGKEEIPTLFVHVPHLPRQVVEKPNVPSMDLSLQREAIAVILKSFINERKA